MGVTMSKKKRQPIKAKKVEHQESEISLVLESCGSSSISANIAECSTSPESDIDLELETDTMGSFINKALLTSSKRCDSPISLEDYDMDIKSAIPTVKRVHFSRPEIESKVLEQEHCIEDSFYTLHPTSETKTTEEDYTQQHTHVKSNKSESIANRAPTPKRPQKFVLDNSAILITGKRDIFNKSASKGLHYLPLYSRQTKEQSDLKPAEQQKSGQLIFDQLGRQGILPPTAKTERTIDELRQAGMMIPLSNNNEQTAYTPSNDAPRRQAPRLIPLREPKLSKTDKKAPWERDVLQDDRSSRGYIPSDYNPPLYSNSGKSWNDDIMPLEVKVTSAENRLKVQMMDLDLL